jgi:hypothetical protein
MECSIVEPAFSQDKNNVMANTPENSFKETLLLPLGLRKWGGVRIGVEVIKLMVTIDTFFNIRGLYKSSRSKCLVDFISNNKLDLLVFSKPRKTASPIIFWIMLIKI